MHEDLQRKYETGPASERAFGIVFCAAFGVVGLAPLTGGESPRVWALAMAALFLGLAFIWPTSLRPFNRLWLRLGDGLHAVMSPLIMALLFFVTIVPLGLLMRVLGKDPLNLRRQPNLNTYWIDRKPPGPAPETMTHQF